MANSITQRDLAGALGTKRVIKLIHIGSDGTDEPGIVIFNNEDYFKDSSKGRVVKFKAWGAEGLIRLEWEATVNSPVVTFNPINNPCGDFDCFGGITNPNNAGATGSLIMNLTGLQAADEVTILLEVAV